MKSITSVSLSPAVVTLCCVLGARVGTAWGQHWTLTSAPATNWTALASSADGRKLVATYKDALATGGGIFTSADFGRTWMLASNAPSLLSFPAVASSADGTKLVVVCNSNFNVEGPIYVSSDSGVTWTQTSAPLLYWNSVASSADGNNLIAAGSSGSGLVYIWKNSGLTWQVTDGMS